MDNIKIAGVPKDSQTKCVSCFGKATWTIDVNNAFLSLCDSCCNDLSHITGEAVTQYS